MDVCLCLCVCMPVCNSYMVSVCVCVCMCSSCTVDHGLYLAKLCYVAIIVSLFLLDTHQLPSHNDFTNSLKFIKCDRKCTHILHSYTISTRNFRRFVYDEDRWGSLRAPNRTISDKMWPPPSPPPQQGGKVCEMTTDHY